MKGSILFLLGIFLISSKSEDYPSFRLPNNVVASSYDVRIRPNLTENSFYGEVNIFLELHHSINYIALNIKDLRVDFLVLDNEMEETSYFILEKQEMLIIKYKNNSYIDPGEHLIHSRFSGFMRSDSVGLFSSVIESEGKNFVSVGTMFSAPYARMVFPCLDEPAYKSKFSIRLVKPDDTFTALSNMAKTNSFEVRDGIAVDFETTPLISPYIVCFVFTQYNHKSSEYVSIDGRKIPLRIFLLDEYLDQAEFLLDVAAHALKFFENYTNMTYPISKLDFIEIPTFIYEGMENIGLVVLTHNSVSYNTSCGKAKVEHQRNAAQLIVHEISHMWFGDVVTPMWYNDLWLAEGFAQLMEIKGLQNQYPIWQLEDMDDVLRHDDVFYKDDAPIVNFPENNDQVEETFGDITYVKGSAVLRMLEKVMGEEKFKIGVRKFLRAFNMSTATTGRFINVMQSITPKININGFLQTYLYQDSFPLLHVTKEESTNSYVLRQRSFSSNNTSPILGRKWTIPVNFISSCNKTSSTNWFDADSDILKVSSCGEKWIKFNHKAVGYYRVIYHEDQYEKLLNNFEELDQVDQANLILETLHLFYETLVSCEIPLKFLGRLKGKEGYLPSVASFRLVKIFMKIFVGNQSVHLKLKKFFFDTFINLYEKLGWRVDPMDDPVKRLLRYELIDFFCLSEIKYEKCIEDAEKVKKEDGKIHPDLFNIWKMLTLKKSKYKISYEFSVKTNRGLSIEKCMTWIKLNL